MSIGHLNTTSSWDKLLNEVKHEFDLWGIRADLPYKGDSVRAKEVTIYYTKNGQTHPLTCKEFSSYSNGAERNLCALREVVRSLRLMDQRGIGHVMAQAAKNLLALPEGLQPDDPHYILGIRPEMPDELKSHCYREAVKYYHPDKQTGNREMLEKVMAAGKALELS